MMAIQQIFIIYSFHGNDDAMTTYGNLGKLCHMLSVTLMIQQAYMVDL